MKVLPEAGVVERRRAVGGGDAGEHPAAAGVELLPEEFEELPLAHPPARRENRFRVSFGDQAHHQPVVGKPVQEFRRLFHILVFVERLRFDREFRRRERRFLQRQ